MIARALTPIAVIALLLFAMTSREVRGETTLSEQPGTQRNAADMAVQEQPRGVDAQAGQIYQAGTRVNFPNVGISLVIPQEWIGGLPEGGPAFLLESSTRQGTVLILPLQASSTAEAVATLSQPVPLDEGVMLRTEGPPQVDGLLVQARVSVNDGINTIPGYLMAMVRPNASGPLLIGLGAEPVEYYQQLLSELTSSLQMYAPEAAAGHAGFDPKEADASSPLAEQWSQRFGGMRVTYMSSYSSGGSLGGGTSTHYYYEFCGDGRFTYQNNSSISGGSFAAFDGGGDLSSSGSGQWRIVTQGDRAAVELRWNDGTTAYRALEARGTQTYMDGDRWFVTPDNTFCP